MGTEFRITIAQSQADKLHTESGIPEKIFAMAYTWSMPLLGSLHCKGVALDSKLASYIYHYAVKRGLMDLIKFAHENGADIK